MSRYVYVLDITIDEVPYLSVHTTLEGAHACLEKQVDAHDVRDEYAALNHHQHYTQPHDQQTGSVQSGGYEDDVIYYAILRTELQP